MARFTVPSASPASESASGASTPSPGMTMPGRFIGPSSTPSPPADEADPQPSSSANQTTFPRAGRTFRVPSASPTDSESSADESHRGRGLAFQSDGYLWNDSEGEWVSVREFEYKRMVTSPETKDIIRDILDHENIMEVFGQTGDEAANERDLNNDRSLEHLILTSKPPAGPPTVQNRGLPESLIWHTLLSLLQAVMCLHTGKRESVDDPESENWCPIVHNFIHPANIFYVERWREKPAMAPNRTLLGTGALQDYGVCKLGNLNRCIVLSSADEPMDEEDEANRREVFERQRVHEETGYEAPELLGYYYDECTPGLQSDLWSIGAVLVAMMTGGSTVWDVLLEIVFTRAVETGKPHGELVESWKTYRKVSRYALLVALAGHADFAMALPDRYPFKLRALVEGLLLYEPLRRGDVTSVLTDALEECEAREAAGFPEDPESDDDEYWERIVSRNEWAMRETRNFARRHGYYWDD